MRTMLRLLFVLGTTGIAVAQVNTEAMRREDLDRGLHHRVGLSFEYQSGNSEYLSIGPSYRADYIGERFYSFLAASYERRTSGGDQFRHEGFAHLRFIAAVDPIYRPEVFVQKEFNEFILLKDRNLIGGGLRVRAIASRDSTSRFTLDLGAGAMFETERIDVTPVEQTNLVRSTNYVSLNTRLGEAAAFSLTTYYQPALTRSGDFRVLSEGELSVRIGAICTFTTGARYRYDSAPPGGLKRYDFKLVNGVGLTF